MRFRPALHLVASVVVFAAGPAAAAPGAPGSVQVVERTETAALLEWTPGTGVTRGFKIRPSAAAGIHPDPTLFPGGKLAAFTWTTDDGYDDNLLYEPIFSSRGLHYTAFIIPTQLGAPGYLTWADVEGLHAAGHEIADHTMHHLALINDRALTVRYLGVEACSLAVSGGHLRTWVAGTPDLDVLLTGAATYYLKTLSAYLDADPDYESTLLAAPDTIYATYAQFIDAISGRQIGAGAPAETLTTARGVHDDAEMRAEILDAKGALESHLQAIDPGYRCRTLGYPNHAHAQWAISTLDSLGFLGARAGPVGVWPYYSQGSLNIGFTTTYEVPHGFPRSSNTWTEAQTRSTFLARMAVWKTSHQWCVLMSHHEGEVDVAHLEWSIDTVASDPTIWIARFDEVMTYLRQYYLDVGNPYDAGSGKCRAWLNGLDPGQSAYVVISAYDAAFSESGWSPEVLVPAWSSSTDAAAVMAAGEVLTPYPNPFSDATTIRFRRGSAGATRVVFFDVTGRRVDTRDLGVRPAGLHEFRWDGRAEDRTPLPAGVYWYRVGDQPSATGSVRLVR